MADLNLFCDFVGNLFKEKTKIIAQYCIHPK